MMKYLVSAPTWCDHLIKKQYRLEQYCSAFVTSNKKYFTVLLFVLFQSTPAQGGNM